MRAAAEPARAGGAAARSSRSGGTHVGAPIPRPDRHPVARRLRPSPRAVRAGDPPPRIRVLVRQRGVARVRARIELLRLPRNRRVARVRLGRVRTGRALTVRLPGRVRLRAGRYLVRLHVVDPRGRALRRSARYPGRARIVVRGRPRARPSPDHPPTPPPARAPAAEPPARAPAAPAPSPGGRGAFPVAGPFSLGGPEARFGAGRGGHVHEGHDIAAAAGTPVVAPYAGAIAHARYQAGGAGEYVVLDARDGRDYFFAHCLRGSTAVAPGTVVAAGQPLCAVGATGTTSGAPHLHFEIWEVGWRVPGGRPIDPLPELLEWAGG